MRSGRRIVPNVLAWMRPRLDGLFKESRLQSEALKIGREIMETRWLVLGGLENSIRVPFLVALVFWLTIIFGSFGLFAPGMLRLSRFFSLCVVGCWLDLPDPGDGPAVRWADESVERSAALRAVPSWPVDSYVE